MSTIANSVTTIPAQNVLEIIVYGIPAPQGSKKFVGHAANGRGLMVESSAKVKPWREAVKWAALNALEADPLSIERLPGAAISGPVNVEMVFTMLKPKSAAKTRKTWPDRKPDLSKLVRSTEDALTDASVWEDDARIIHCISSKVFPNEGPGSLRAPGCLIRITSAEVANV